MLSNANKGYVELSTADVKSFVNKLPPYVVQFNKKDTRTLDILLLYSSR